MPAFEEELRFDDCHEQLPRTRRILVDALFTSIVVNAIRPIDHPDQHLFDADGSALLLRGEH